MNTGKKETEMKRAYDHRSSRIALGIGVLFSLAIGARIDAQDLPRSVPMIPIRNPVEVFVKPPPVTCQMEFTSSRPISVGAGDQVIAVTKTLASARARLTTILGRQVAIFRGSCDRFVGPVVHFTAREIDDAKKKRQKDRSDQLKANLTKMKQLGCDTQTQILKGDACITCRRGTKPDFLHTNCVKSI